MMLEPKAGFDWGRVAWGRPDSPRSPLCSYCSAALDEDAVPLCMWTSDGRAAQFCDDCQEKWFGLDSVEEEKQ
jgi:hypothetical protein